MKKYQQKYRISSARASFWNYGWDAFYFITICTYNKECWFGDVVNGKMILSDIGEIVKTEWLKTFQMRPDMNLMMGEYVVMPNHFHAIIGIGKNQFNTPQKEKNVDIHVDIRDGILDGMRDDIRNIRRGCLKSQKSVFYL